MNFCVDVTSVCVFLGINAEQFNSLTIAQVEEAKWGLKNGELEERRKNEETMNEYRYYFEAYETFVSYFGEKLTNKYLPIVPLEHLVEVERVRVEAPVHKKCAKLIGHGDGYFPVRRGPGSRSGRKEFAPADIYKVSSDFQGLRHNEIITAIFDEAYPWLQEFNLSIYGLNNERMNEFYVETEEKTSFYVPFKFFANGDIEGIVNRNENYLLSYTESTSAFEKLIETPTVKRFLALVATHIK